MSAPPKSFLDASQCTQGAFDDATGSFRTTVVNIIEDPLTGATEVSISDTDDSIKIGNGSGQYVGVNSDGSLNVNVVSTGPGTSFTNAIQYAEITNVAMGATETVLTYTVPGGGNFFLCKVNFSGDCISEFDLQINSSTSMKQRLSWTKFNSIFDYSGSALPGFKLSAGTTINVIATNYSPENLGNFNATLEGVISS